MSTDTAREKAQEKARLTDDGMLVLSRDEGESILVGEAGMVIAFPDGRKVAFNQPIEVVVLRSKSPHSARIGVSAPRAMPVHRAEVFRRIHPTNIISEKSGFPRFSSSSGAGDPTEQQAQPKRK